MLLCDGHRVTAKAFDLLLALVNRLSHLVEKHGLLKIVCSGSFVQEGNLAVTASELRSALNDDSGYHRYIEMVSKRAYRAPSEGRQYACGQNG